MNTLVVSSVVLVLALMSLETGVSAQTFQYSRGWTNGKRSSGGPLQEAERLLANPCHAENFRNLLQGRAFSEKRLLPCDMLAMSAAEPEGEVSPLRLKRAAPDFAPQPHGNRPTFV